MRNTPIAILWLVAVVAGTAVSWPIFTRTTRAFGADVYVQFFAAWGAFVLVLIALSVKRRNRAAAPPVGGDS